MGKTAAFILAGGAGKRLSLLTSFRAKPAVPFAGKYRIIDFTLTNCVRSGISEVYILTQYISRSLIKHLGIGKPWDLDRAKGGLHILHPHLGYQAADWYKGTADAIYQNIAMIMNLDCRYVLILSGDHVYNMDYGKFLEFHKNSRKPVTIGVIDVPRSLCSGFGIATIDSKGKITKFDEKPKTSSSTLASMGIYIFNRDYLIATLKALKQRHEDLDFGKHIMPYLVSSGKVAAYRYRGYWLDIGTLKSYFGASLSLLGEKPRLALGGGHSIMTVPDDNPPSIVSKDASLNHSLVCNGCVIRGKVESSVISPGVTIERGATVENSIILHGSTVRRGARIKDSIIDKMSIIGRSAVIGYGNKAVPNAIQPDYLDFGISVVGRMTVIPAGIKIGTNCLVSGSRKNGYVPRENIGDGESFLAEGSNI